MKNNINIKKKIIIICCFSIITGIAIFAHYITDVNIMHRIYRAYILNYQIFNNIPALQGLPHSVMEEVENFGGLSIPYKEEYLRERFEIYLFFPRHEGMVKIRSHVLLSDNILLNFYLSYDYHKKVMIYEPIEIAEGLDGSGTHHWDEENINRCLKECNVTREDIKEYQEYALYEVVMKTWLEAHGGNYKRAYKRMKKAPLIDNTFAFTHKKESEENSE